MLCRRESPWHLQPNCYRPACVSQIGEAPYECDGHRMGAHAVARDAARGVGGVEEGRDDLAVFDSTLSALELPGREASGVEMVLVQFKYFACLRELSLKLHPIPPQCFATQRTRLAASRPAHDAIGTALRKLSILDRCAGLLAEGAVVHERLGRPSPVRVSLGVPDLKAIVVESNRSPVGPAHSHGHPLIPSDDRSAAVASLANSISLPELDQLNSRQAAVMDPLSDQVSQNHRIHARQPTSHIGILLWNNGFPLCGIGQSPDAGDL